MTRLIGTGIAVLLSVAAVDAAQAELWCYRDFGSRAGPNCAFPTLDHCLRIVAITGGICEREPVPAKVTSASQAKPAKVGRRTARSNEY